ncbi:protein charybde-like [Homarus americanus]|uniref:protein charybde-like n=1 Tax=Homarus americanus TaxID=6706 RepID=UPI001C486DEB|nr:protein charybde-like [Homarus americanus]
MAYQVKMDRVQVMRPNLYDVLGSIDATDDLEVFEVEGEVAAKVSMVQQLTQEVTSRADALGCGQVMVPNGLIDEVTAQVLRLADSEPCGLRGGVLHVLYDDGQQGEQELTRVVLDPTMPNTYEVYLTLTPDTTTWYHKMSRIIKPLRKSSPLLLSTRFKLEKRKLYPEE